VTKHLSPYQNENQLHEKILNEFINCASNLEVNLTNNSNFIREYKRIKWFVISDTMSIINKLSIFYPKKVIKTNGTVSHVVQDPNGYFKAILDANKKYFETNLITFKFVSNIFLKKFRINLLRIINLEHRNLLFCLFYLNLKKYSIV
jgi:hypothetical protein